MATAPETKFPANGEMAEAGNVTKIREILFGSQMREYEKRILSLEDRMVRETQNLRDIIMKRIDGVETFCREEIGAQQQQLKAEKGERVEAVKALSRELTETGRTIEKRLDQMDEDIRKTQTEYRSRLLEQSKTLSEEINSTRSDMTAVMDQAYRTLHDEKIDRTQLGDFFTELGMRLRGEFELPEEVSEASSLRQKELTR